MAIRKAREIREETTDLAYNFLCQFCSAKTAEDVKDSAEEQRSRPWINRFLEKETNLILKTPEYIETKRILYSLSTNRLRGEVTKFWGNR
jgi:hypothetical protein